MSQHHGPIMPSVHCRSGSSTGPFSPSCAQATLTQLAPRTGQPSGLWPHSPPGRPSHPAALPSWTPFLPTRSQLMGARLRVASPMTYLGSSMHAYAHASPRTHVTALLILITVEIPELSLVVPVICVPRSRAPCLPLHSYTPASRAELPTAGPQSTSAQQTVLESGSILTAPPPESHPYFSAQTPWQPPCVVFYPKTPGPPKRHPNVSTSFQQPPLQ